MSVMNCGRCNRSIDTDFTDMYTVTFQGEELHVCECCETSVLFDNIIEWDDTVASDVYCRTCYDYCFWMGGKLIRTDKEAAQTIEKDMEKDKEEFKKCFELYPSEINWDEFFEHYQDYRINLQEQEAE